MFCYVEQPELCRSKHLFIFLNAGIIPIDTKIEGLGFYSF